VGFGSWLRSQRIANESGEITDEQYAQNLESKATRVPDPKDAEYLKARARFVRDNKANKARAEREKKPRTGGLW
jgi:hypothetical protein